MKIPREKRENRVKGGINPKQGISQGEEPLEKKKKELFRFREEMKSAGEEVKFLGAVCPRRHKESVIKSVR